MSRYLKIIAALSAVLMLCSCTEEVYEEPVLSFESEESETEPETEVDLDKLFSDDESGSSQYDKWESSSSSESFTEDETLEFSEDDDKDKEEDESFGSEDDEESKEDDESESSEADKDEEDEKAEDEEDEDDESSSEADKKEKPTESKKDKSKPNRKKKLIDVPYISQKDLPTGCELVSTAMLLEYYDYIIEPVDLIEGGYIPTVDVEKKNGKVYGGDPNKAYIGDPSKDTGFGCYGQPVYTGLNKLLKDEYFTVYDLTGMSLDDICSLYIDLKQPVLIWGSIDMKPFDEDKNTTIVVEDTDEEIEWMTGEHCVVLVGYDEENYYINDPKKGAAVAYDRSEVTKRYEEMGCQAVTVVGW